MIGFKFIYELCMEFVEFPRCDLLPTTKIMLHDTVNLFLYLRKN